MNLIFYIIERILNENIKKNNSYNIAQIIYLKSNNIKMYYINVNDHGI